jgi:hypothetical protein
MSNDLREGFLYWWPVFARAMGVLGAFTQAGYAVATRQAADAGFLAFCGALIAVPSIFGEQDRRNRRRELGEDDDSAQQAEGG